ncbi:transposase [Paenibacillus sp. FSL H8-0548]|uniref:IS21 family transposase n=1 Tax=Paenibacillus sp. FSL H8-0548 TaxID=1920422 RepID=UPI00096D80FC|nr:IS21 family transposase [Paenibacillus sp. FSL H8-0548]OMF28665.1 transposase [Paenibacillus sp. FSL H8-0548]
MISLIQKQNIILMNYRDGRSQREISRMIGVDRKTIRKYIERYEDQRKELISGEDGQIELIRSIVETPTYTTGKRPKRKLTAAMEQIIQAHLEENEEKRRKGQRKQQKKPMDIYEAMAADGANISYSTVLRAIRKLEQQTKEAYIKASYEPGDVCEFDWGEVKLTVNGTLRVFQMAAFTSAYGNYRYAHLFTKQTTECFQEAHARFFAQVNGVYQTLVYDNMKVAVKRFVGTEKEPTDGLLQLSVYYGFGFRFCNIHSGNEKGHVERTVEVVRRKAFAFRDTFETLEEANAYLLGVCERLNHKSQDSREGKSAIACLEEERPFLFVKPPLFDAARVVHARVDKYATVIVDQNHYSVPDHLVGKLVLVKIYSGLIQCFYEETKIAEHNRLVGCHEWRLELDHYLDTLKKKPGALAGSTALAQAQSHIKHMYETYYTRREKDFVELLHYLRDEAKLEEVQRSIQQLYKIHPSHVTTVKVKALCAKGRETVVPTLQSSQASQAILQHAEAQLRQYDDLFGTHTLQMEGAIA